MATQFDRETLEKAIQYLSFKSAKEWAKARKIDTSAGPELINSQYRTEMQGMEKVFAEQFSLLLDEGNTQLVDNVLSKAKGPMLKTIANLLKEPNHSIFLTTLLNKFQSADYSSRKAILNACQRLGDFSHLEILSQIEATLRSRKKPAKSDEELAKMATSIAEKIVEQDEILKILKNDQPSLEQIRIFNIDDLHLRIMQLPFNEMLDWLKMFKEDNNLGEEAKQYALKQLLSPANSKGKIKPSFNAIRYGTILLALMGVEGKEKMLINNLSKMKPAEQQRLMGYIPEKLHISLFNKLLSSPATIETGIWHFEQDHDLISHFKDKLLKIFEESKLPIKIRVGYLLLKTNGFPAARIFEFEKRLSLYAELTDHCSKRSNLYLALTSSGNGNLAPALHRCKKRESLFKELQEVAPEIIPIITKSWEMYDPLTDDINDLIWLLGNTNKFLNASSHALIQETLLREIKHNPQNIDIVLKNLRDIQNFNGMVGQAINYMIMSTWSETTKPGFEILLQYNMYADSLVEDWKDRWHTLNALFQYLSNLGMAEREFSHTYWQAVENKWDILKDELKVQMEYGVTDYNMHCKEIIAKMDLYQKTITTQLTNSLKDIQQIVDKHQTNFSATVSEYLKDCTTNIEEVLVKQSSEIEKACQLPVIVMSTPSQYKSSMETLLLCKKAIQIYDDLENRVNYNIALGLSVLFERLFIALQKSPQDLIIEVEKGISKLLKQISAQIITSSYQKDSMFNPDLHKSNQMLKPDDKVRVISPGIVMTDHTIIRHAMVEKLIREA